MKKTVLYLIILSSILMLVSWTQIGKALDTQESIAVVSVSNLRVEVPDYPLDGKFFNDTYLEGVPSGTRLKALDYSADAVFFKEWYRDDSILRQNMGIPDYPLDGKFFVDHYAELQ